MGKYYIYPITGFKRAWRKEEITAYLDWNEV
jgi:hypothetical protein